MAVRRLNGAGKVVIPVMSGCAISANLDTHALQPAPKIEELIRASSLGF
jgi:hypothetical protein